MGACAVSCWTNCSLIRPDSTTDPIWASRRGGPSLRVGSQGGEGYFLGRGMASRPEMRRARPHVSPSSAYVSSRQSLESRSRVKVPAKLVSFTRSRHFSAFTLSLGIGGKSKLKKPNVSPLMARVNGRGRI